MLSRSLRSLPAALSLSFTTAMAATTTATCQKAGVIFLHGLGDTPAGWSDIKHQMAQLNPKLASPEITWDFPAAPVIPISVNGGATMPGWFDLYDWPIDVTAPDDPAGTMRAVETIRGAIAKLEAAGVPTERIVVGGFSQGGAAAIAAALAAAAPYAGVVAVSGWCAQRPPPPAALPRLFFSAGTSDPAVTFKLARRSGQLLAALAREPTVSHVQRAKHDPTPAELAAVDGFIRDVLR